jgi:hypothetical protein
LTSSPLRIGFSRLYEICDNKKILVAQCGEENWHINFRRMLDSETYEEWLSLQNMLNNVELTVEDDEICWGLTPSKCFTTKSLYRLMTDGELLVG